MEVMDLVETSKMFGQSPCDYWLPGIAEASPEAKYLIDRDLCFRYLELRLEIQKERNKQQQEQQNQQIEPKVR